MEKIRYKDLSSSLKWAVCFAWLWGIWIMFLICVIVFASLAGYLFG